MMISTLRHRALPWACFAFGPLIYLSSRATVAAMVLVALTALAAPAAGPRLALRQAGSFLLRFLPIFLWMLLSSLWSLDTWATLELALRLLGLAGTAAILAQQMLALPISRWRRPIQALALGLSVAAAIVALDLFTGGHLGFAFHPPTIEAFNPSLFYARAATLHAVFVVPLLMALIRLRAPRLALLHTATAWLALFATASLSAKIALVLGVALLASIYIAPRLRWAGLALLGLAASALPLAFPVDLTQDQRCWLIQHKPSALHRLLIWDFVAAHIDERPLTGWGLDASRRLPGGKAKLELDYCGPEPPAGAPALLSEILPLHPHNGILQLWLELGGIGVLLGVGPALWLIAEGFSRPSWQGRATQAMLAASLAAALSVALVSFGVWQEWFLAGLGLALALALLAARLGEMRGR
jgi:O-antigen ligase